MINDIKSRSFVDKEWNGINLGKAQFENKYEGIAHSNMQTSKLMMCNVIM